MKKVLVTFLVFFSLLVSAQSNTNFYWPFYYSDMYGEANDGVQTCGINLDGIPNGSITPNANASAEGMGPDFNLSFGSNSYIEAPIGSCMSYDYTIATWIYIDPNASEGTILSIEDGSNQEFYLSASHFGSFGLTSLNFVTTWTDGGTMQTMHLSTNGLTSGWHHVALRFSLDSVGLLIDGKKPNVQGLENVTALDYFGHPRFRDKPASGASLYIGGSPNGSQSFDSLIGEVRLWPEVLDSGQIRSDFRAGYVDYD